MTARLIAAICSPSALSRALVLPEIRPWPIIPTTSHLYLLGGVGLSIELQKLGRDLTILEAMVDEIEDYLRSDVLFWQMMKGGLPKLTLGGYFMRQHRLLALQDLLEPEERLRLNSAVSRFSQALEENIVRLEQKGHRELEARLRQWGEYLKDLEWERAANISSYSTAVETRAMIAAMADKLKTAPYRLDARISQQIGLLDANLRRYWQRGDFIWPEPWIPAYPMPTFWWLYGRPRQADR